MNDISILRKVVIAAVFAFIIMALQQNVQAATGSQTGQVTSTNPKIVSVTRSSDVVFQNDTLKIGVLSNVSSNVQYRFWIYSYDDGKWRDLFNGYSTPVSGNQKYEVNVNNLSVGKYKISVWVKTAGTTGSIKSSIGLGSCDDYYAFDENCNPKINVQNLSSQIYQNDDVTLTAQSDIAGKVQYRVFVNKLNTNEWLDKSNGYSSPVDGTTPFTIDIGKFSDYGDYRISVWVKRYGKEGIYTSNIGLGGCDNYYCFSKHINPIPQIKSAQINNMTIGSNPSIKLLSNISEKVQYRVFINKSGNNWDDVTGGYSSPVNGNVYYTTKLNEKLSSGKYRISVWVKNAGTDGKLVSNQGLGSCDNYYVLEKVCAPTINVTSSPSSLIEGDTLKLNVSTPELNEVQYRVFVSSGSSNIWTDATNGYTSPVSGSASYELSINPPFKPGKYRVSIWVKEANTEGNIQSSQGLGSCDNYYCFTQVVNPKSSGNISYTQTNYGYTIQQVLNMELSQQPVYENSNGQWVAADSNTILKYLDPTNYINDVFGRFEFLKLTYYDGISADDINNVLRGKGVLENKGAVFLQAAANSNINPMYLVSHALLETGNGTSNLATGITVNGKTVYNMFGIGAYDANADYYGSQYAYSQGWFSVDAAINGGAKFVSSSYINNPNYNQDTLYKMRWNPNDPSHQYATDVKWAINQIYNIKSLYDLCPAAKLIFDLPNFK
ncbi:N-acetylglucosaminidase [Clostridium neuense]|uniref:N-acetylglucosaminidase n=1 Tax=Clostridium neuense TaxID=1728934 RepID=A0ABW8TGR2_9CLOT